MNDHLKPPQETDVFVAFPQRGSKPTEWVRRPQWTAEKPTKAGWYWYRPVPDGIPSIERVVSKRRKCWVLEGGREIGPPVPLYRGEWAGPLEMPL
ncbi:MAG: hypothetical protein ABI980_15030 [Nitrospirota bacterium]